MRQKDLVLSTNEFVFIQNKTHGAIKTYTGPIMVTISQQESMVIFDPKSKRFKETADFEQARQLFTSAPEGWYVVLKNPAKDGMHPDAAKAVNSPDLEIGRKINISGPCSFPLFPGQMTKVVQGHKLRSNQYLLARVYDADAASKSVATIVDAEGNEVKDNANQYFVGQLLVIKGTEVSFYMPPTGIEVIPNGNNGYVREAVTLERLEYAILKDEDGEKRYVHGPAVVSPQPTETFVDSPKRGTIFRALELSPISGIYVKVIADYKDADGTEHKTGEELFITGNEQMIYYPRPEHALIQYDGKYMHHAIAIPEGEGRYILDRLNGKIKTVVGPAMYLPDPRTEVVVKRKLTDKECALFYPGNTEVLTYNLGLTEKAPEKLARADKAAVTDAINCAYSTSNQLDSLAIFEATANISRGVSYTKPRTITLDTKYEGVVTINVWTGYAVNVISKTGKREVVLGPTTRLLDYDETLESIMMPDGPSAYLRVDNNKITSNISAQTKDFVDVGMKVSYCVNFIPELKDKWFYIEEYTRYLNDRMTSIIKREVKNYTIQEFYATSTDIIRNVVLDDEEGGHTFTENGMRITDVEMLAVSVERSVAEMLEEHQTEMIQKTLELADADAKMKVITALAENDRKEAELKSANDLYKAELRQKAAEDEIKKQSELTEMRRAADAAVVQAKADLQTVLDEIDKAELARKKASDEQEAERQAHLAEIEKTRQEAYAATVKEMMSSISPDLVAALTSKANADILTAGMEHMAPYALAEHEEISTTVDRLLRGTPLEGLMSKVADAVK